MTTTLESIRILETQLHAFYLEPISYDGLDWHRVSDEILYVLDDVQYILQHLADAGIPEITPAGHDITLPHRVRLLALRAAQPVNEPDPIYKIHPGLEEHDSVPASRSGRKRRARPFQDRLL